MSEPLAFVVGWPVAHSRSPLIHRFWLRRHGLAGDYQHRAVPPADLAAFLASFAAEGFRGGNVTLPHKEAAFRACRETTEVAGRLGAANTLWLDGDRLCGDNTDVHGFAASLDAAAPAWRSGQEALVVGAGGATRAILVALLDAGYRAIHVANRTPARAEALALQFGEAVKPSGLEAVDRSIRRADLVVNATSAEMGGAGRLAMDWAAAHRDAIATDIVYVPLITPFLRGAADAGLTIVDGLGMLLHQAAPGFERWFGLPPAVDAELRAAVLADLGE